MGGMKREHCSCGLRVRDEQVSALSASCRPPLGKSMLRHDCPVTALDAAAKVLHNAMPPQLPYSDIHEDATRRPKNYLG
ncbi:hypothetical protein EXIGLDRAFT_720862 [Exidia glandulosa HHB12029]|uniref:Uncharacterized protein n=1 Tax=Exidia glandulosa HHB12029 TaxID=1314781 RepID=A0A165NE85_EXIGL|nr:hypothetical protein EXIGLDRAFT_720862 [Exidia glandulosa HHB12029]